MLSLNLEAFEGIESKDQISIKAKGSTFLGSISVEGILLSTVGGVVDWCKAIEIANTNPSGWISWFDVVGSSIPNNE